MGTQETLAKVLSHCGDVPYVWHVVGDTLRWLLPPLELLGEQPISGRQFAGILHPEDALYRQSHWENFCNDPAAMIFDCEYRLAKGCFTPEDVWVHERAAATRDAAGTVLTMQGCLRPSSLRRANQVVYEHLVNFDALTGVMKKARLREMMEHALTYASRYQAGGIFMSIGIDKMAVINDAFGQAIGDAVIAEVGQRLKQALRASDALGRLEGDMFGLILYQCAEDQARATAQRFLDIISKNPIDTEAGPLQVTASMGGVIFPRQAKTWTDCLAYAEQAMHQAKKLHRNCFVPYRTTEHQRATQRQSVAVGEEVRHALRQQRLRLAFQEVVDAKDNVPRLFETLLRLEKEDGSLLNAGYFITAAEQLGLMRQIDQRVLELVVQEVFEDPNVNLAFNISGLTAGDGVWFGTLHSLLHQHPDKASRLIIEITETVAMGDSREWIRFVTAVRDLGCHVAIDDFGSGHTSFRQLKLLPVDFIKIDGAFVRSYAEYDSNRLFIKKLMELCRTFGLNVIAEGIEQDDHRQAMVDEGVTLLQGYYFGRPTLERRWKTQSFIPWHQQGPKILRVG